MAPITEGANYAHCTIRVTNCLFLLFFVSFSHHHYFIHVSSYPCDGCLGIYDAHMAKVNLLFDQLWDRQMGDTMMEVITNSNLHCGDRSQTTEGIISLCRFDVDCINGMANVRWSIE
jgi:hypothetical protein